MSQSDPGQLAQALGEHELVEQLGFVRRVARALVRNAAAAEDVAQDALLAALTLERPPRSGLRPWLYGVVRNLARDRQRRSARHDELGPEPASAADAAEAAVAQGEQAQLVVETVMGLSEPYRTVVLMRYLEERSPREVAEALGRPVATVETQLARGIARMREQLDRRSGGDRSQWLKALSPLVLSRARLRQLSGSAGTGLPVTALLVLVALVPAALLASWLLVERRPDRPEAAGAGAVVRTAAVDPDDGGAPSLSRSADRSPAAAPEAATKDAPGPPGTRVRVVERGTAAPIVGAKVTVSTIGAADLIGALGAAGQLPPGLITPGGASGTPPPGAPPAWSTMPTRAELDALLENGGMEQLAAGGFVERGPDGKLVVRAEGAERTPSKAVTTTVELPGLTEGLGVHVTDDAGAVQFDETLPASATVTVLAEGFGRWSGPLDGAASDGLFTIELEPSRAFTLLAGSPPPGTSLGYVLRHAILPDERSGRLRTGQRVVFESLVPGDYLLDVELRRGARRTLQRRVGRRIHIDGKSALSVAAWESSARSLDLEVVADALTVVEGATMLVSSDGAGREDGWVDEVVVRKAGARFVDLPAGELELWARTRADRDRGRARLQPWTGPKRMRHFIGGVFVAHRFEGDAPRGMRYWVTGPLDRPSHERLVDAYVSMPLPVGSMTALDPLPPGAYELWAVRGRSIVRHRFEVAKEPLDLVTRLDLPAGGRLRLDTTIDEPDQVGLIELVTPSGFVLPGARLVPGEEWELPEGDYGLRFDGTTPDPERRAVEVRGETALDLVASDLCRWVELRAVVDAGAPPPSIFVLAGDAETGARRFDLDDRATTRAWLRPGDYRALDPGGRQGSFSVEEGAGTLELRLDLK